MAGERHGRGMGTAWALHGMFESAFKDLRAESNRSQYGAHSCERAARCGTTIVRCSWWVDVRVSARLEDCIEHTRANLLWRRNVKVIRCGWKTDSSVDQPEQRIEHRKCSSNTVQTRESLLHYAATLR